MDLHTNIEAAARDTAYGRGQPPTPGQAKAGNYRLGRVNWNGLRLAIENPRGTVREGVAPDGTAWRNVMQGHYGYIEGTKGADGDGVDVFVGPVPESGAVYVVNQVDPATGAFDEHKAMLGYPDQDGAEQAYRGSYDADWQGLGSMVACSLDQFRQWLKRGDLAAPLTAADLSTDESALMDNVQWNEDVPADNSLADLLYWLRQNDPDGLLLDPMTPPDIDSEAEAEVALDALVLPFNQLQRKMQQLYRVLQQASNGPTPAAMTISKPFRLRGVINVSVIFELSDGQTITIWFHSAGASNTKIQQQDELVSWRWALNKKDVSILVAKENGQELNPRIIARRVMALAARNSDKFAKANADRAERLNSIDVLKRGAEEKRTTLETLTTKVTELKQQVEQRKAKAVEKQAEPTLTREQAVTRALASRIEGIKTALKYIDWDAVPGSDDMKVDIVVGAERIEHYRVSFLTSAAGLAFKVDGVHGVVGELHDDPEATGVAMARQINELAEHNANQEQPTDHQAKSTGTEPVVPDGEPTASIDPTTPDGYAKVMSDEALQLKYQDQLDALFQGRILAVRNALRRYGWESDGPRTDMGKEIGEAEYKAGMWANKVGAGGNVVGVSYSPFADVSGEGREPITKIRDDLSMTPEQIAAAINAALPAATEEPNESGLTREQAEAIANTIAALLGGNQFATMTGAKNFAFLPEGGLQFSLPPAKNGINVVAILVAGDGYDVTFYKKRGVTMKTISQAEGVAGSDLARVVGDETGLATSLGDGAKDNLAETDAALTAIGFKRVMNNSWATTIKADDGRFRMFSVRAYGEQTEYRLDMSAGKAGLTGGAQTIGTYQSLEDLMKAARAQISVAWNELVGTGDSPLSQQDNLSDREKWYGDVLYELGELLGIASGDAQAVAEAKSGIVDDAWDDKLSPADAAKRVAEASRVQDEPAHIDGPEVNVVGGQPDPSATQETEPAPTEGGDVLTQAQAAADADPAQESQAESAEDVERAAHIATLKNIIDENGTADLMDLDLPEQLTQIHDRWQDDAELMDLFNQAANRYSNYMVEQARAAMA